MSEEKERDCEKDPARMEREEKRKKAIEAIKEFVASADCDPNFKSRILDSLPYSY